MLVRAIELLQALRVHVRLVADKAFLILRCVVPQAQRSIAVAAWKTRCNYTDILLESDRAQHQNAFPHISISDTNAIVGRSAVWMEI